MKTAIVTFIVMVGCVICLAASDEEIKKKAGDNYQSIESCISNIILLDDMQKIAKGAEKEKPKTKEEAQAKLDSLIKLATKILEEDKRIDETKLNKIYSGWGTNYKNNIVKGTKTLLQGMQSRSSEDIAASDKYFADWDKWWSKNYSKVFLALHDKFGYEIK